MPEQYDTEDLKLHIHVCSVTLF